MAVLEHARDLAVELDWDELYEVIKPRARGILQRYRVPLEDVEDVLHDTLLLFLTKSPRVEDPAQWILGTLKRRCRMYWRSRQRQLHRAVAADQLEALTAPAPPSQETALSRRDLQQMLARIPRRRQRLLEVRYFGDHTPAETARILGYRQSGIYKALDRSLESLAREMDHGSSPPGNR